MKLRHLAGYVLVASILVVLRCAPDITGGGGTEWEAKIVGVGAYDGNGLPASGAKVTLYPEHFLKDTVDGLAPRQTVADKDGRFVIDRLEPGAFIIEVNDGKSWASLTKCEISPDDTRLPVACTLKPTSRISGKIAIPPGYRGGAFVQVYGLDRIARAAPDGVFILNDVPQGAYTIRILPSNGEYLPKDVREVSVSTGAEINIGTLAVPINDRVWKYQRSVYLNTSSSGANVQENVCDFPVLVRLTSNNFNFSEARPDGGDLRFTKVDGTIVPHETERWDAQGGRAEIWVNVDTVYGNNSSQSMIMRWGAPEALSTSAGPGVFDTTDGFLGVWHLAGSGSAIEPDATANHFDGTPSDTVPASAAGAVGVCRSFNGSSNGIRMNGTAEGRLNFGEGETYTLSAWVYTDTLDLGYHVVAGKGNEQYFLGLKKSIPDTTMRWEFVEYHDGAGWQITEDFPAARVWTHIVGVRKGPEQFFFVNGVPVDSSIFTSAYSAARATGNDFTIGRFVEAPAYAYEGKCPFLGKIDEVRLSRVAYNAHWIKLCYMNQKEQDALVTW